MRIESYNQKFNYNICFGAGLTHNFSQFVKNVKPKKVEEYLASKGIQADFAGNKPIAACTYQVVQIFENLGLKVPNAVYATDKLKSNTHGVANSKGQVYFNANSFFNLDIDSYDKYISSLRKHHLSSTPHFLKVFLHEFSHIQNFAQMEANGKNVYTTVEEIKKFPVTFKLKDYILKKYGFYFKRDNLLDAWAEIMEKRLADSLEPTTLFAKYNPFSGLKIAPFYETNKSDKAFSQVLASVYDGDVEKIGNTYRFFA